MLNENNLQVLIPAIVAKLSVEEITKLNYTQQLAEQALSGCVLAVKLITALKLFESDIFSELEPKDLLL